MSKKTGSGSELAARVGLAKKLAGKARVSLTRAQMSKLKAQGNSAEDWKRVKVSKGFDPSRVRNSRFVGACALGKFKGTAEVAGAAIPTGVYGSVVCNSVIGDDALVQDVKLLSNQIVCDGAALLNDGVVASVKGAVFGNGLEIPVAIETGGREIRAYAEITLDTATRLATSRGDKAYLKEHSDSVDRYLDAIQSDKGIIDEGALVANTGRILSSYIGPYARIDNANAVLESTILSAKDEPSEVSDGAHVKKAMIQWGCKVTSMAMVGQSVMMDHSHAERHGKVQDSIIASNTEVAEGEVTACLLGPFVGFHHQSLLIAALWPEGKGNVGYGANVGSNHTSKAPDQEIWAGEGTFFGLGVNIKFPSDFTRAPYSIIATAVNALPQRVTFPFSLINSPAERIDGVSPAYNEIMPGWVLGENIFTIKRNEGKYKSRNKSKRTKVVFEVFRPEIVDMMIDARARLRGVTEMKEVYTDRDIKGIGKNYLKERSRASGIEAYDFYIRNYALTGLWRMAKKGDLSGLLEKATDDPRWEHERAILLTEFEGKSVEELLRHYAQMQKKIAEDVSVSKAKDDIRGARIIGDYAEAHEPASENSFVKKTLAETEALVKEIEARVG